MDDFEQRMTYHLGRSQIPNTAEVKVKVANINKIVNKMYDNLVIPAPIIIEIKPEIKVENI